MEELIGRTKKIKFVHDTYWTARSGVAPAAQIREFGHRLLGIHLRDLAFKRRGLDVLPHDTFIGGGVINFKDVLAATAETGCEYAVIEENSASPYESIKKSYDNLLKIKSTSEDHSL